MNGRVIASVTCSANVATWRLYDALKTKKPTEERFAPRWAFIVLAW